MQQLEGVQDQIRQYRPWFDESVRGLTILRCLTEAFPEDGSVTAKTVEIRDLNAVTCTGIARDCQALLKTIENVAQGPAIPRGGPGADARANRRRCNSRSTSNGMKEARMQIKNRQQLLIIGAIAAVALFAGDQLVLSPLLKAWSARATRICRAAQEDHRGNMLVQREQSIRSRWEQMSRNALPNNTSAAEQQVFKAIDHWAQNSGVAISAITPQWKHDSDDYMTFECRVDAAGDLGKLSRFLYSVERDPMALKLELVELGARDKEGQQLSLGLQLSGLVLNTPHTMNPMRTTKLIAGELMVDSRRWWRSAGLRRRCAVLGLGLAGGFPVAAQEPDAGSAAKPMTAAAAEVLSPTQRHGPGRRLRPGRGHGCRPTIWRRPTRSRKPTVRPQAGTASAASNRFANPNRAQNDDRRSRGRRSLQVSAPASPALRLRQRLQSGQRRRAPRTNDGPASLDYSAFKVIVDRNIFDPNRFPHRQGAAPAAQECGFPDAGRHHDL